MTQLFDVVIFDEASQVPPADAVPSIVRGRRVAVAGDEQQLPPTAFFTSASPTSRRSSRSPATTGLTVAVTTGYESVLDSLATIVPFRSLAWHYRSQDERLIAFSNAHIYDCSLTTFPGAHGDDVLPTSRCPSGRRPDAARPDKQRRGRRGSSTSSSTTPARPSESLGVITMGIKHADRDRGGASGVRARRAPRPRRVLRRGPPRTRSSSRTSSAYRATSATRSSSPSATARTPTAACCTGSAR